MAEPASRQAYTSCLDYGGITRHIWGAGGVTCGVGIALSFAFIDPPGTAFRVATAAGMCLAGALCPFTVGRAIDCLPYQIHQCRARRLAAEACEQARMDLQPAGPPPGAQQMSRDAGPVMAPPANVGYCEDPTLIARLDAADSPQRAKNILMDFFLEEAMDNDNALPLYRARRLLRTCERLLPFVTAPEMQVLCVDAVKETIEKTWSSVLVHPGVGKPLRLAVGSAEALRSPKSGYLFCTPRGSSSGSSGSSNWYGTSGNFSSF